MKAVELSKTLINILINDKRTLFSLSKQNSLNLLINLDYSNVSYVYDNFFQKIIFHPHLITLKQKSMNIDQEFL